MIDPLLSVEEVATLLGVTRGWVYHHLDELPHLRVGRFLRFQAADIEAYLAQARRTSGDLT